MTGERPILQVRDLEVQYHSAGAWRPVVTDVSLTLHANEILGIVGESGSGKSVTASAVMGLTSFAGGRITSGSIEFEGVDLVQLSPKQMNRARGDRIAMVFQEPMTSLNPSLTVGEQIAEVVRRHRHVRRRAAWARAVTMLDLVGIAEPERRAKEYPHNFSGGMRQRVMIAMALACEPALLIADEPTTALDVTVQAAVLELLMDLQARMGMAMVLISHDLGVVGQVADTVAVMYAGEIVEFGGTRDVLTSPRHPYTAGLLRSMPELARVGEPLGVIPGSVPTARNIPTGCRFHPRCEFVAEPQCTTRPIPLLPTAGIGAVRCARDDELQLSRLGEGRGDGRA